MPLETGLVLEGRYRIAKLLGQGGFGAVYRAWDLRLNRPCAVKENLDPSIEAERQFEKEAVILANLHHPNLPRVTDTFTIPRQGQYLVMDYVEGEDLQQMVDRRGQLPEEEVLPWIEQICDAVHHLHTQDPPIIHRDIKPANIKITPGGQPVLVDFGIAKVYDPVLRTTMGARAVTPGYSPPEQYGRGRTDPRSDVYALGATLFALLTGQEPADSVENLIRAEGQISPRDINASVSEAVAQAVMRAMDFDPERRFQSAEAFKAALRGAVPASQPAPRPVPQPAPRPAPQPGAVAPAPMPRPVQAPHRPVQVAPAVGAARPIPTPLPAARPGTTTARVLAIVSLVLGLVSWVLSCFGVATMVGAVVTGLLVLTKYRKEATKGDRAMAIIGVVSAVLTILAFCFVFGLSLLQEFNSY